MVLTNSYPFINFISHLSLLISLPIYTCVLFIPRVSPILAVPNPLFSHPFWYTTFSVLHSSGALSPLPSSLPFYPCLPVGASVLIYSPATSPDHSEAARSQLRL